MNQYTNEQARLYLQRLAVRREAASNANATNEATAFVASFPARGAASTIRRLRVFGGDLIARIRSTRASRRVIRRRPVLD